LELEEDGREEWECKIFLEKGGSNISWGKVRWEERDKMEE